ncbi:uncharacterized protein LOC109705667 [Ananas comosus]|uniref:Uncharacterized protein LOC109705667 n=1 Tax=Ananas comosus TaxID=4615 RepID=A0A6P5EKQ0_ANACO|nr:uncharacterized protein LOC109705667 [Ananas comosus]
MMSKELRDVLIYALQNPEPFYAHFAEVNMKEALYAKHVANVIFTDEDMLLGTAHHNRPLYVTGTSDGDKINRILIDPGSSINILTLRTLKSLALNVDHLSSEKIVIQGFNQHSQKALGSIILPIKFGALRTEAKFYVINADTSYKALMGRPWLHEYNVVPSTLHQCMKYIKDGEEFRVDGDIRPFGVHEVRYEDARYFAESEKDIKLSRELEEGKVQSDKKSSKGKIKIEDNKKNAIPHFGSDSEDSDDEEQVRKMLETFSFKLNMPWGEDSSEDEEMCSTSESNMFIRTPELIEDSLAITRVPDGYIKSLHISEPTKVNDLKTFFVPPQVEKVKGKERIKKGILFYKSDDYKPSDLIKLDNSDEEIYEDVNMPKYFSKNLKNMMNRSGIPARRSRDNRNFFQKMWNPPQKRVVLPNGRTVHTRGLGYHQSTQVSNKSQCSSEKGQLNPSPPMTEMTYNDSCAIRHTCTMITIKDMEQDEDIEPLKAKLLELKDAPQELEDGGQATVDKLIEINLGNEEDRRPTYISALLPEEDQDVLKALLMEYKDFFAWTYKEMPGLDPSVAVHKLAISPDVAPVKQAPRRTRVDLEEQIITETKKLIEAGFIREEKYADWITSIVPVKKKNGQIRICVDFRDLNKACPKDDFPLPVTELMIDNTSSYEMFSFMDGSSGYNQIKMAPEDEKHTAFRTPIGIYCYKVMPFGLKNAGATYQRAMTIIFDDLLHKVVECYVDDLVVKTVNKANHFEDLRTVFTRLKKYNLKMNPLKCAFGVYSGKFLGFIVRHRGIEIDPAKIKAIMELPPPKNLKQLRSFQGRLAYIRRFISNLSGRIKPFSKLVKKDAPFIWDDDCQTAFDDIKKYLLSPPVLAAPIHGRPLILYTAALEGSLGALLAQNNEEGKESALYYLSRMLVGAENFYSPIEKHCLALIFAVKKLRHYMLEHKIHLISRVDPLKFLMTRPVLTGRLAKWAVILLEFDITYVPQKAIKGQALTDFLAAHPIPDDSPLVCDLPDEHIMFATDDQPYWKMYFDGASSIQPAFSPNIPKIKAGIGLIFVTPEGGILRYSLALSEPRTNNEAEYEALIAGLEIAIQLNIQKLHIFGDSQLIINQVEGEFKST